MPVILPPLESIDVDAIVPVAIGPGCTRRDLPAPDGLRLWIVDIAAGAQWPWTDEHDATGEYVYVVSGELVEEDRRHGPGQFLVYGPWSRHRPRSDTGVRLFGMNPLASWTAHGPA